MRKGFTRKPKPDEPATSVKNYITPSGLERLKDEHRFLLTRERPAVTEVVAWAAGNGDRGENADYQYGQAAAAADRWANSLSHQANRSRGSGGP
jgi:transcription elongation factor GreB